MFAYAVGVWRFAWLTLEDQIMAVKKKSEAPMFSGDRSKLESEIQSIVRKISVSTKVELSRELRRIGEEIGVVAGWEAVESGDIANYGGDLDAGDAGDPEDLAFNYWDSRYEGCTRLVVRSLPKALKPLLPTNAALEILSFAYDDGFRKAIKRRR